MELVTRITASIGSGVRAMNAEIAEYEEKYGLKSARLLEELSSGKRQETEDLLDWLMLIRLREWYARYR